jgi:hypothetical protein
VNAEHWAPNVGLTAGTKRTKKMDATTQQTLTAKIAALPAGTDDLAAFQQLVDQPAPEDVRTIFFASRNKYFNQVVAAIAKIPAASLSTMGQQALYAAVVPNAISFSDFRSLFQQVQSQQKTAAAASAAVTK